MAFISLMCKPKLYSHVSRTTYHGPRTTRRAQAVTLQRVEAPTNVNPTAAFKFSIYIQRYNAIKKSVDYIVVLELINRI